MECAAGGLDSGTSILTRRLVKPVIYPGIHHPSMARHLERCMLSINRLEGRKSDLVIGEWILDSGAFSRISTGKGHMPTTEYAAMVKRWARCGRLKAAVAQDYMCEPHILELTGMTVREHQRLSTENYLALREAVGDDAYVMPVLQGYGADEYHRHLLDLSPELGQGAWVGLGSVCKRQGSPAALSGVMTAVLDERPDLRLHGFGVKTTALRNLDISARFHSVDSMAWSFSARYARRDGKKGDANSVDTCIAWLATVEAIQPKSSQVSMSLYTNSL